MTVTREQVERLIAEAEGDYVEMLAEAQFTGDRPDLDEMTLEVEVATLRSLLSRLEAAEAQLKVIEDWGTEEINAAVDLRQKLAQTRVELNAAKAEIERLETRVRSLNHALNFILSDAAWTPKHPACESIINRINALRKGADQ